MKYLNKMVFSLLNLIHCVRMHWRLVLYLIFLQTSDLVHVVLLWSNILSNRSFGTFYFQPFERFLNTKFSSYKNITPLLLYEFFYHGKTKWNNLRGNSVLFAYRFGVIGSACGLALSSYTTHLTNLHYLPSTTCLT